MCLLLEVFVACCHLCCFTNIINGCQSINTWMTCSLSEGSKSCASGAGNQYLHGVCDS